ncbi:MAG: hypothetical protein OEV55_03515, partial [candidate division Zixibacteria bacterium]|nr:hypothetical protein [candidate division Zixibacteria bacterium]
QIEDLKTELEDRFGPLPKQAYELLEISEFKLFCQEKKISKLSLRGEKLEIEFDSEKKVEKEDIKKYRGEISLPLEFSTDKGFKLRIRLDKTRNRLEYVKNLLQKL